MVDETKKALKSLKAGTNVTMSGVNNIATTRGPNLFTKTDVDTAVGTRAKATDVNSKTAVDLAIAANANIGDVTTSLALKAKASDIYTKTGVDANTAFKANKFGQTLTG